MLEGFCFFNFMYQNIIVIIDNSFILKHKTKGLKDIVHQVNVCRFEKKECLE